MISDSSAFLPSIFKAFEHIFYNQMSSYLDGNALLDPFQSGLRKHCGKSTALVKILEDLMLSITVKQFPVLVLLDFSKAFDTNHNLILSKLSKQFGFEGCTIQSIKSYLLNRSQYVEYDVSKSETVSLNCWVPQGSILGSLLFSSFINDLLSVLTNVKYHMYADDFQIYSSITAQDKHAFVDLIN